MDPESVFLTQSMPRLRPYILTKISARIERKYENYAGRVKIELLESRVQRTRFGWLQEGRGHRGNVRVSLALVILETINNTEFSSGQLRALHKDFCN
jgi:hypothetical protein